MNRFYFTVILIFCCTFCRAQFEHATWYFGEKAGVSFSSGAPVGITDGQINTGEGCASVSDDCGNILFYTDGGRVYNRNHTVMQNGYGLAGNSTSTQSAIIVPNPANADQYYIFTIYSISGFYYSVVDMTMDNGNGGLVPARKNIQIPILQGQYKASEKVTVALTAECNGFWIITHAVDKFYSFKLTDQGFATIPVITTIGMNIPLEAAASSIGYLKASADSKKLAIAHKRVAGFTAEHGALAIYDFDNTTGVVSNENILYAADLTTLPRSYYGVEFSPNGQVLYATTEENALYQYDLTAANIPSTEKNLSGGLIGALQLGVDRKIYLSPYDGYYLSVINEPNQLLDTAAGTNPDFIYNAIFLEGKKAKFGVPSFIIPYHYKGKIAINAIDKKCGGDNCQVPLGFKFLGCPDASLVWDFGDGNTSTAINPVHNYASIGTYTILLTYTLKGHSYTTTTEVTVHPLPNAHNAELKKCPDLNGNDVLFDLTESYPQVNPGGENVTYSFHLTELEAINKQNLQPLSYPAGVPEILWVRVENEWGCFSVVELELLFHNLPNFISNTPVKVCANSTAQLQIRTAAGNTVNWFDTLNGTIPIFTGNNFITPVLTATTRYWAETFNGSCYSARSGIIAEVVAIPQLTVDTYHEICNGGTLILTAASNADTINWYLTNGGTVPDFTGASYQTTSLTAATSFWVEAVNSVTGCKSDKVEVAVVVKGIVTPTFNAVSPVCEGELLSALPAVSLEGIIGTWSPALDNTQTTTYTFTPDASECAASQTITITINPPVTPTFSPVAPICSGQSLSALPTISLEGITGAWSPALDNLQTTTYTFSPDAGQCAAGQSLTITVTPFITPTFNMVAPICSGTALTALPKFSLEGITGNWSPALNNSQTTNYTFSPDAGQCATNQTLTITVNLIVIPTFNAISPICAGASLLTLPTISLEGIIGTWSPALDNRQTTTYTFTPDAGQCTATPVLMTITVNPVMIPYFSNTTTYCQNAVPNPLPLTSDNGIRGTWLPAQIDTAFAGTSVYEFSPDAGQCTTGKATLNITVIGSDAPVFNLTTTYCQNAVADALPNISDNGIIGTWSPGIIDTSGLGIQTYTFTPEPGTCTIIINQFELTVGVVANTTPVFALLTDYYFEESPRVLPKVSDNGIKGNWYPAVVASSGAYSFVPDSGQCARKFYTNINVVSYPKFFTPNDDGYNDFWNVPALQNQSNSKIVIYNRYGKILVMMKTQDAGWNGTYKGKQLPSDDYWFVLTYINHEGLQQEFKSHFALKR